MQGVKILVEEAVQDYHRKTERYEGTLRRG
jgi:hypothetical protein